MQSNTSEVYHTLGDLGPVSPTTQSIATISQCKHTHVETNEAAGSTSAAQPEGDELSKFNIDDNDFNAHQDHDEHSKDYPQQNGGYMCPKGSLITKGYGHTQLHDWRCHSKQLTAIPPHLKVQFWLQSNYDAWLNSATVLCIKQGTAPYLEEEDGTCVTNATLKSIHHRCCAAWAKLVVKKLALPTWTRLCASGQTLMQSVMEMEFPKHHLDQDGSWKNPDKTAAKHKAMGDNNNNSMHSDTKPNQAPVFKSKGKKHECIDDSLDSELTDKCQKVSSPINISNLDPWQQFWQSE
ncbi:hypothetical protein EDB19DRAFT_1834447 [Suillus lakei]|nr:hypothetical protein EDB19DRAFT_1834447 [Suillus lakei]